MLGVGEGLLVSLVRFTVELELPLEKALVLARCLCWYDFAL